jgi:hypothetical protein
MVDARQLNFPFSGGLNEKLAAQYLDPNQNQISIVNGNFTKVGAVDKRLGLEHLPNTLVAGGSQRAITSGNRLAAWSHADLSVMQPGGLYTYSTAYEGCVGVAALPAVKPIRRPVTATQSGEPPYAADMFYNGHLLRVLVYLSPDPTNIVNVSSSVYDVETGDIILEPTLIQTPGNPIISLFWQPTAPPGKQLMLFTQHFTGILGGEIDLFYYDPATNAWTAQGAVAPAGSGNGADMVPMVDDPAGGFVIAYSVPPFLNSHTINVEYHLPTTPAVVTTLQTIASGNYILYPIYIASTFGALEHTWVSWTEKDTPGAGAGNTSNWYQQYDGSTALVPQLGGPQNIIAAQPTGFLPAGLVRIEANSFLYNYTYTVAPSVNPISINTVAGGWNVFLDDGTRFSSGHWPCGYVPVARSFTIQTATGPQVYQPAYLNLYEQGGTMPSDPSSQQVTLYLMQFRNLLNQSGTNATTVLPVATVAPRQVFSSSFTILNFEDLGKLPFCSQGPQILSTQQAVGVITNAPDISSFGGPAQQNWMTDFYFDKASLDNIYGPSELLGELHLTGGVSMVADSLTAFEDSFFYYPEFSYVTTDGNTATFTGTYSYFICYSFMDAAGLLHRSAPVPMNGGQGVTPHGGEAINLHILNYSATWRDLSIPGQVYADIFRTTDGGPTFFFLARVQVSNTIQPYTLYGPDSQSDQDLQVSSVMYITGGVLDNVIPPSPAFGCVHRSRYAIVDETLRNVWFTKQASASLAPGYNEALIVPFPEGGDITQIASLDDKFVAFKDHSIWIMYGDGPAQTGQGSDWTIPQKVASDVGCVTWQSLVLTPVGLMFRAENGIYLLDRGCSVSFIGVNVVDTLRDFPLVTSATLVPDSTQVRFTCTNGESSIAIIYDYLLKQWTTHIYAQLTSPVISAVQTYEVPSQFTLQTQDGNLWQEHLPTDAEAYYDQDASGATHFVTTSVSTAWVKVQLENYQQLKWIQFMGIQNDACGLQMNLSINYDPAVVQTSLWNDTDLQFLPIQGNVQFYTAGQFNMCMSAQITVFDTVPTTPNSGQGMRFIGLCFDLDTLGGMWQQVPVAGRR